MDFTGTASGVNIVLIVALIALVLSGNFKLFNMSSSIDELKAKMADLAKQIEDAEAAEAAANETQAGTLDELKAAVTAQDSVIASAVALLQGLKAKLDAALSSGNPAELHALSAELGQNTDALAAAITANTPAS